MEFFCIILQYLSMTLLPGQLAYISCSIYFLFVCFCLFFFARLFREIIWSNRIFTPQGSMNCVRTSDKTYCHCDKPRYLIASAGTMHTMNVPRAEQIKNPHTVKMFPINYWQESERDLLTINSSANHSLPLNKCVCCNFH